jgi:hypothetical protein
VKRCCCARYGADIRVARQTRMQWSCFDGSISSSIVPTSICLQICDTCGGADGSHAGKIACTSLDCAVYFERAKVEMEMLASASLGTQFGSYLGINKFFY